MFSLLFMCVLFMCLVRLVRSCCAYVVLYLCIVICLCLYVIYLFMCVLF